MAEDQKKSQGELQKVETSPVLTKAEVNFLVLPYFSLDKDPDPRRRIEFKEMQQRGSETFEIIWTVIPHPEFGLPRDFDRRLQRAVEHSLSFLPRPLKNPVSLPCFRELARIMGVTCTGRFVRKVKQGFVAMMMTAIMSKRSYYNKHKKTWVEEGFHLYDKIVFKGEQLADGRTADRNYAWFTSGYLDNLNSMYVRPVDFGYLKSLRPIASRLYELLGVKFYGHNDHIQYKYSTLCNLLPTRRQKSLSRSRQQLELAHDELKGTGFLESYEWIQNRGVKDDWYIRYVPGERFFRETGALQFTTAAGLLPISDPAIEEKAPGSDDEDTGLGEGSDHLDGQELERDPKFDELWLLFAGIVKKYPEFDLRVGDRQWFMERVEAESAWGCLDLAYEIQNWGDWLDIEHRKKARDEGHKFPKSNFKGSLMNWLRKSMGAVGKREIDASTSQGNGRKGWELDSDYRVDIM